MLHTTVSARYSYDELADLTIKKSLRPIAKELFVTGYSRMNKAALIAAILDVQLQESATQKTEVEFVVASEAPAIEVVAQHNSQESMSQGVVCEHSSVLPSPWDTEPVQAIAMPAVIPAAPEGEEAVTETAALPMLWMAVFFMVLFWAIAQVVLLFGKTLVVLLTWLVHFIEKRREMLASRIKTKGLATPLEPMTTAMSYG